MAWPPIGIDCRLQPRGRLNPLSNELTDTGITVTCLMPGATETDFFERAEMTDTKVGSGEKAHASDVAKTGFDAMMKGELSVVAGFANKMRAAGHVSHRAGFHACGNASGYGGARQRKRRGP